MQRFTVAAACAALLAVTLARGSAARAQEPAPLSPQPSSAPPPPPPPPQSEPLPPLPQPYDPVDPTATEAADPRSLPPVEEPQIIRPGMSVSLGMGATLDRTGFEPGRTEPVPTFLAVGTVGDDRQAAFEFSVFATQASGRFRLPDSPVDRLGFDVALSLRPFWKEGAGSETRFGPRVLRSLAAELGLGFERVGRGPQSGSRFGAHSGVHVDLPLSRAGTPHQLHLRVGVRRLWGLYDPILGLTKVGDTVDLYAAAGVSF